jgi:hypothetical protein
MRNRVIAYCISSETSLHTAPSKKDAMLLRQPITHKATVARPNWPADQSYALMGTCPEQGPRFR